MRRALLRAFLFGCVATITYVIWTGGISALILVVRLLVIFACGFLAGYQEFGDEDLAELIGESRVNEDPFVSRE